MKTAHDDHPTLDQAAEILRGGGICAFPTETVYGLGADATNSDAVLAVYEAKGRPRFNPLIVHCADREMAERLVTFPAGAEALAALWPGPLTLVLPRRADAGISDIVTAGLDTLAVRIPAHPLAQSLIRAVGRPLAAPSANPSGKLSPTTAAQVRRAFGGRVPVLDGGPCQAGLESTIVAVDGERLVQLRAGAMSREEIAFAVGRPVEVAPKDANVAAPGMLRSHYAPAADLRLDAAEPLPGEAYLAFGPSAVAEGPRCRNLSPSGDLHEAARNLFSALHEIDASGVARIAVAPIPDSGLGEAINDRLRRAAAPRD
ncbi:MAG TPA: L-threonylcarbamoyladenylate synthase [Devosiaceae bacterium]